MKAACVGVDGSEGICSEVRLGKFTVDEGKQPKEESILAYGVGGRQRERKRGEGRSHGWRPENLGGSESRPL